MAPEEDRFADYPTEAKTVDDMVYDNTREVPVEQPAPVPEQFTFVQQPMQPLQGSMPAQQPMVMPASYLPQPQYGSYPVAPGYGPTMWAAGQA